MELSLNMTDKEIQRTKIVRKPNVNVSSIKKNFLRIVISLLIVTTVGSLFYFVYKGYKATKDIGFNFSPGQLLEQKKDPELKKDSTGKYTNVLIVGKREYQTIKY